MKLITMIVLLALSTTGFAATKISSFVFDEISENGQADVIIYMSESADLSAAESIVERNSRIQFVYTRLQQVAEDSQAPIRRLLASSGYQFESFFIDNAILVKRAEPSLVNELVHHPSVDYIGLDVKSKLVMPKQISKKALPTDIRSHLKLIDADKVWQRLNVRGEGIVIASQDSGILWSHNAIVKQYRGYKAGRVDHNYNWHDGINKSSTRNCPGKSSIPCDDTGHGTHTVGTMVGDDGKGNQIGVAPKAQWIACRNMDKGVGTVSSYMRCFEFFMAPYPYGQDQKSTGRTDMAPHIINNSWACLNSEGCTGGELLNTVKAFKAAGILIVAAAGNDGPNCSSIGNPPGSYSSDLLSVGAYNRYNRDIAYFSSLGPSRWDGGLAPNLIAPGTLIRSAVHKGNDSYDEKAGTSMAAPHVAGAAALLWSAHPKLIGQINTTIDILQSTSSPLKSSKSCSSFPGDQIPNAVFGHGMVNPYEAIKSVN